MTTAELEAYVDKYGTAPAEWDKYRDNNHHHIAPPKVIRAGAVGLPRHMGKPLNDRLWMDLIHRMCISGLCVYRYNEAEWTLGWGEGHCNIYLDENDLVSDIRFNPYNSHFWHRDKTSSVPMHTLQCMGIDMGSEEKAVEEPIGGMVVVTTDELIERQKFSEFLKKTAGEVAKWPKWKRDILGKIIKSK